jgi:Zn-dependent M28 family amino/carboxypeptidase
MCHQLHRGLSVMIPLMTAGRRERKEVCRNVKSVIHHLSVDIGERTIRRRDSLNRARHYIIDWFTRYGVTPREETYRASGEEVSNITAEIRGTDRPDSIILVGAHYDTIEDTPGADDNASGVAALLELFRLMAGHKYRKTVRFAAFTLEEPPFFSTDLMGSAMYANACRKRRENIELMVCLEMIGFASRRCHQDYPLNHNRREFPVYGSYISVISLPSCAAHAYLWKKTHNGYARNKTYEYIGPASIPGMDLSDHMSFIRAGYPAIMISDTGFYRNKNYHTPDDTFETINFDFMVDVILAAAATLGDMADREILVESR